MVEVIRFMIPQIAAPKHVVCNKELFLSRGTSKLLHHAVSLASQSYLFINLSQRQPNELGTCSEKNTCSIFFTIYEMYFIC